MIHRKMILTFPPEVVGEPIAYTLVKDFDIRVNILRAKITPEEEGTLVVDLQADADVLDKGIAYLQGLGITVTPMEKKIVWSGEHCTHCTACLPICPPEAFRLDRATMAVWFDSSRCIVCEQCLKVCPFHAVSIAV